MIALSAIVFIGVSAISFLVSFFFFGIIFVVRANGNEKETIEAIKITLFVSVYISMMVTFATVLNVFRV